RAVRKAKQELRDFGLIDWENPGGPRHGCRYGFDWHRLSSIQERGKAAGEAAYRNARSSINTERPFPNGVCIPEQPSIHTVTPVPTYRNKQVSFIGTPVPQNSSYLPINSSTEHDAVARAGAADAACAPPSLNGKPNGACSSPSTSKAETP